MAISAFMTPLVAAPILTRYPARGTDARVRPTRQHGPSAAAADPAPRAPISHDGGVHGRPAESTAGAYADLLGARPRTAGEADGDGLRVTRVQLAVCARASRTSSGDRPNPESSPRIRILRVSSSSPEMYGTTLVRRGTPAPERACSVVMRHDSSRVMTPV